jgi:hypothetical protein
MTLRALTVPTINVQPNPPPYGELHLRKGAWDQLQARRAYRAHRLDDDSPAKREAECDREI